MLRSTVCIVLIHGLSVFGLAAEELQVGDPAPPFELAGSDGKTYRLADFDGKKTVVLAWFPKAFTPGCTAECSSLRKNSDELKKFDIAYFTASCDKAAKNKKFAESLELDYPILSDPEKKVAEAYGVVGPGRLVARRWTFYIGPDGKIIAIDKDVRTGFHGQDVVEKLKHLHVPTVAGSQSNREVRRLLKTPSK